jgi:hypothetical protein
VVTRSRILQKPQILHQKYERDCGVWVFAKLAGISEEELLAELPDVNLGMVTVDGWRGGLKAGASL